VHTEATGVVRLMPEWFQFVLAVPVVFYAWWVWLRQQKLEAEEAARKEREEEAERQRVREERAARLQVEVSVFLNGVAVT
jgi:flagellar biosynthesis component FlhA